MDGASGAENQQSPGADDERSATSQFTAPQINLPKGGGAICGIGEKLETNAATGTSSLTIPIPASPARSGFTPQLSLSYDSGAGNGVFGVGWSISAPSITRKTDKGLPRYGDFDETDVFILSGSEDLVPVLRWEDGRWRNEELERDGHRVKLYRPRIEGLFARIERWTRIADGDIHWRSFSTDNVLTLYGGTRESRICEPANERHVFSWLISSSFDDRGNAIAYEYAREDERGVDLAQANERNRVRAANRYLKRVKYGNHQPFRDADLDSKAEGWMFEIVLDYGDADYSPQAPDTEGNVFVDVPVELPERAWAMRRDPFSRYRSTFEIRTYRLCQRALLFHRFPEELDTPHCLVQSIELEYEQKTIGAFLKKVIQSGYTRESSAALSQEEPPGS